MEALDKRQDARVLVLKTGSIRLGEGNAPIACAVLNVSASGACILLPSEVLIAERFELILDRDGTDHHCQVMWREGARIGVRFVPHGADHPVSGPRGSDAL
jgi:hypothetical protein